MVAIMSIVCLYVPTQEKVQNPGFGHGKVYLNKKVSYGFTQFSIGLVRLLSLWSASSPAREGLSGETRVGGRRASCRKPHTRTGWGRGCGYDRIFQIRHIPKTQLDSNFPAICEWQKIGPPLTNVVLWQKGIRQMNESQI